MNRTVYTLLLRLAAPVVWASMAWSARRSKTAWAVLSPERFGYAGYDDGHRAGVTHARADRDVAHTHARNQASAPRVGDDAAPTGDDPGIGSACRWRAPVWVHAVSVGETRAAQPLIRALLARGDSVLLTHTTPTGRQIGQTLYAEALASGQLRQAWLPYDFPGACARFLSTHAPRLAVLIEREVWPNMVAACGKASLPIALVSARLSERGLRRTLGVGAVLKQAYAGLDIVCAQSQEDLQRLQTAGVRGGTVSGNLKFDVVLDEQQLARGRAWRAALDRPVIALISTREGEDELFAPAIKRIQGACEPAPLVVWVPRHAQRFDQVAAAIGHQGLSLARRSASPQPPEQAVQVYLGDTLGEMAFYLGAANVAIIGGSFAPLGAQNFIEACAAGVPVVLGPSIYNFKDAAGDALAQGLVEQVGDADLAMQAAWRVSASVSAQAAFAVRAQAWLTRHFGATQRILDHLPAQGLRSGLQNTPVDGA